MIRAVIAGVLFMAACKHKPPASPPVDPGDCRGDGCAAPEEEAPVAIDDTLADPSVDPKLCEPLHAYLRDAANGFAEVRGDAGTEAPTIFQVDVVPPYWNCYIEDDPADGMTPPVLLCEKVSGYDEAEAVAFHDAMVPQFLACLNPDYWSAEPGQDARTTRLQLQAEPTPRILIDTHPRDGETAFTTTLTVTYEAPTQPPVEM